LYYHDNVVVDFLQFGWPLDYKLSSLPDQTDIRNHAGARNFPNDIDSYFQSELNKFRIVGPFHSPPVKNFIISPLNSVPKPDSLERRIIADLSWPFGKAVNDGISSDTYLGQHFKLTFPNIDDICNLILTFGQGCCIYKRDLKSAYRQFPTDPHDYNFAGYFWKNAYYFDTVLAMGRRNSALACQRITQAVIWIHRNNGFQRSLTWMILLELFLCLAQLMPIIHLDRCYPNLVSMKISPKLVLLLLNKFV